MRKRIEDLGRIYQITQDLLDNDLFNVVIGRTKDFPDTFMEKSDEAKYDLLHEIAYGIRSVKDKICDINAIAAGHDDLNESLGQPGFEPETDGL